eukprot:1237331-Prymnesium_polylepis.6
MPAHCSRRHLVVHFTDQTLSANNLIPLYMEHHLKHLVWGRMRISWARIVLCGEPATTTIGLRVAKIASVAVNCLRSDHDEVLREGSVVADRVDGRKLR